MSEQVEKTDFEQLKEEAKSLGIDLRMNEENMRKAIDAKKQEKGPTGISSSEAKSIETRLRFEEETRQKIIEERALVIERARIIAESESLCIPVTIPENPTELDLARARKKLKMKKKEVKPSPETVAIEAGKRGYYIFTNREQENASHTVNPGGKYTIHLIPDQIHVLSDAHIKLFRKTAIRPVYERVPTGIVPGEDTVGRPAEECIKTSSKPRFAFELVGEAPQEAPFGLVTDAKILKELKTNM